MADDCILEMKKQRSRWQLTLASGERLYLPAALLRAYPLEQGQPFDPQAYESLTAKVAYKLALERAAWLLGQRDYSSQMLCSKLIAAGFAEGHAQRVCAYLEEQGFLDDRRYAAQLLQREKKRSGARKIAQRMRQQGLDEDLAAEMLERLSDEEQIEAALQQARKYLRNRPVVPLDTKRKTIAMLARRGYGYSVAERAAALALSEAASQE